MLKIRVARNYGNVALYPEGDEASHVRALTGRKTVSLGDLKALRALGVQFCFDLSGPDAIALDTQFHA